MQATQAVVVSLGPLAPARAVGRGRRRRRRLGQKLCAGASVFVLGQLVLHRSMTAEGDASSQAATTDRPDHDSAARVTPPAGGEASGSTADLDALYPPEDGGWGDGGGGPWLDAIRDAWTASLGGSGGGGRGGGGSGGRTLPPLPRLIHQTWKDAFPPRELFAPRWRASLQRVNPGWSYRLWGRRQPRARPLPLPLLPATVPSIPLADPAGRRGALPARAQAWRRLCLHLGVYFDLDYECFAPLEPLVAGASLVLSYKEGSDFAKGASNSVFGSAPSHPLWAVVLDVLRNRSRTPLSGHTAVLFSTGPAVLREALRRLLRLRPGEQISAPMLTRLRETLGIAVLDSALLHPVTAERRDLSKASAEG
ncbi:hypothetical protein EMIHUDRAFT_471622, partial [Emiliania huxleyi CCMP1516]|uniref:Mannosyltransferase n=2 Tax=Emiliania huxleyi TaxID=2903 RepID=A0A0D3KAP4_EMIH1